MGNKKYKKLLIQKGFKLINTCVYKKGKKDLVIGCKRGKSEYVAKIFYPLKVDCPLHKHLMRTEIQAFLFLRVLGLPFFPKYVDHIIHKKCHLVVMEKIVGKMLLYYSRKRMSLVFWKSLIHQLIVIVFILEDLLIIHHDFLDRNIILYPYQGKETMIVVHYKTHTFHIPNAGFIVKAIDFQFMHHYTNKLSIVCKYAMTDKSSKFKNHMGLSHKFYAGTDLNLIFGILLGFKHLPASIKRTLKSLVNVNTYNKQNRRYALLTGNPKTLAAHLLANFDTLFK